MDARRFDEITKSFEVAADRRGVLKGVAGAALAGLFALVGAERGSAQTGARCQHDNHCQNKCGRRGAVCCNGRCVAGCGPRRFLHEKTCKCCRTIGNQTTCNSEVHYCGA